MHAEMGGPHGEEWIYEERQGLREEEPKRRDGASNESQCRREKQGHTATQGQTEKERHTEGHGRTEGEVPT